MVKRALMAALAGAALCARGAQDESVVAGENPAISRDGRRLAFQRIENRRCHLGVVDLATGRIEWVARGDTDRTRLENACHPAWGPDGSLVYSYANMTNTAYERFSAKGPKLGYALRVWKDGSSRELVGGLTRNFSPSFTPDGRTIYFCRQGGRGAGGRHDFTRRMGIARVDAAAEHPDPLPVIGCPSRDAGLSQPVVSPDGRWLAYAELSRAYGIWGIKVGRLENPKEQMSVSSGDQSAYAPNWFPDSRHIVYTGFSVGDPGWCVYVMDVASGAMKRLCEGEDACVAPDGRSVYYSLRGEIRRRAVDAADFPAPAPLPPDPSLQPEQVLARYDTVTTNRTNKVIKAPHACSPDTVHFYRYKFFWDGRPDAFLCACAFGGAGSSWSFVLDHASTMSGVEIGGSSTCTAGIGDEIGVGMHEITSIIAGGVVYNSIDGCVPMPRRGRLPRDPCAGVWHMNIFPNGGRLNDRVKDDKLRVESVEMGIGWPKNVPRPLVFPLP